MGERSTRRPRPLAGLAAAGVLVGLVAGCAQLRILTGPRIGGFEQLPAVPSELDVREHRDRDRLRFLVFGDAGTGRAAQLRVAEAMRRACEGAGGCDFALVTGDLIYPTGVRPAAGGFDPQFADKFETPYRGFGRFDFWLVTGNHDWYRSGSAAEEVRYSRASERWRMPALDYPVPGLPEWIAIYGLDSTLIEEGVDNGQLGRARRALCAQPGWSLAFSHHGLYTAGRHGDRQGVIRRTSEALLPLIRDCGVQLHFAGHDHLQAHLTAPEFEQIVQGAGGRKLHRVRSRDRRPPGVELLEARSAFGFALVEADPGSLRVSFYEPSAGAEPTYCRIFNRASFADGERSRSCG